ncbi:MAG TPA: MATE family efflux transporter [Ktedonobacterales bacterium]
MRNSFLTRNLFLSYWHLATRQLVAVSPSASTVRALPARIRTAVMSRPLGRKLVTTDKELSRRVWRLALPSIGEQLLALGVGVSDTFLAGHLTASAQRQVGYDQATAVASVGIASTTTWILLTTFFAVGVGATALVARATGARDESLARRGAEQAILLGFLGGLALFVLAAPMAEFVLTLLGVTGRVAQLGAQFIRVFTFALPGIGIASAANAAMRGSGDTRRPLIVMLSVNGTNVLASWILLNGLPALHIPAIGVVGSAVGAASGWLLGAVVALSFLRREHTAAPRVTWAGLRRFDRDITRRILHVGLPSAAELTVFQGGLIAFGRMVIGLGPTSYAAYTTINTVESLGTLPGLGFAVAATALVGQSLGAHDTALAERSVWAALRPAVIVMGSIALLALVLPHLMFGLFVADPAVARVGEAAMRISMITITASAFAFVFNGALRGAGDTKFPVLVRAGGTWGFRLPLALLLIPPFGLLGARVAMALDYIAQSSMSYWRFRSGKWRKARV